MHNIRDNIKIVDGDRATLRKAKFRILVQKIKQKIAHVYWAILVLINKGRF